MRFVAVFAAAACLFAAAPASATPPNVADWGGPVITTATVHVLYWGTTWTAGDTEVNAFVPAFVGSGYVSEANEYERGATVALAYANTVVDSSSSPNHTVGYAGVKAELVRAFGTLDPAGLYIVLGDTYGNYGDGGACAWHDYVTDHGHTIPVEYLPDDFIPGEPGQAKVCSDAPAFYFGQWTYGKMVANRIAHETLEAVTDPMPCAALTTCVVGRGDVAWAVSDMGSTVEVADLCVGANAYYTLTDSSSWLLQAEWSDAAAGCI